MKRASNSYRLQLIKEVATRQERLHSGDPLATYIQKMLDEQPNVEQHIEHHQRFSGCHFDDHAGGWVSDKWGMK
ncbi:hypothetical protein [Vibrio panuliri]|uniref:Uncharacterized protein n=1 Tax=Vibrio panuliri TaxID=1381081 RepID=A0A1Q9HEJ8_9VIBR|nr:hypothetical protein [Vibrio panuliri]KAB1454710.1 hypothetical protein F7O85_17790 [Vibrio panuliri]OLQ88131.1 hypothetical protein BIY22_08145 [Vibrio panuliri]OLQ96021.1 hypothetical protein BIY20_05485 [Vibrio panuliri]